jgi:hypothetical protein
MASDDQMDLEEMKVDTANLYEEQSYTDLRVASIRRLIPVKPDGSRDLSRNPIFVGHTNVMSSVGPLPIESPIEAKTLEEAIEKFPAAVQDALERLVERAQEHQRRQASRIVVPETGPGRIQLR